MEAPAALLSWHGAYAVLREPKQSSRALPGDKITLPPSVLKALYTIASPGPKYGQLTDEWVADASGSAQLPSPMIFRIENPKNGNVVYAGVREFTAREGTMGVTPYLLKALDIKPEDCVPVEGNPIDGTTESTASSRIPDLRMIVRLAALPKGTYVRLRPLEAGYDPDDWKALLEQQLRKSFTSLTINTVLSIHGARGEHFKLLVDKFVPEGDGICVIDTDLEVDIEALDEEQARETVRQRAARGQRVAGSGSSAGGELDIWKEAGGRVAPGDYVDYVLPSWDRTQNVSITLSGLDDETSLDLFVTPKSRNQRALPRDSVHVFGDFARAVSGSKTITIPASNASLEGAESILISVHASGDPGPLVDYTIRARVGPVGLVGPPVEEVDEGRSPDDEQCENCLKWIPKQTMMLHHNFCLRNNTVCPRCKSVLRRGSPEWDSHWHCEHDDAFGNSPVSKARHDYVHHAQHSCSACEFSTNSLPDLARHRTIDCPEKLILCRFCHLEVAQEGDPLNRSPEAMLSGLTAHELAEGSRTMECRLCEKLVRLRNMEAHMKNHEWDKSFRSAPQVCRNANCGRTLFGVGVKGRVGSASDPVTASPQNDIGLCSRCFAPMYVSLDDPDGQAMRRRMERRYLGQLLAGCRKSHCLNRWCKTGQSNSGVEGEKNGASSAKALVPPDVLVSKAPLYFCVDEESQAARKAAEAVAADKVWDLAWCIAAVEAEGPWMMDKVREWLDGWAPRRSKEEEEEMR